jgi:hypothetical protein
VDEDRPGPVWRDPLFARMIVIGLVLGLAVFSRFVNGLLAPLLGVILLITAPPGRRKRTVAMGFAIIAPVAVVVGVLIWPRLWSEPLAHMQEAWSKLSKPHSPEPFLGRVSNRPPRSYFVVYLWATAPLGLLVCAAGWFARAIITRRDELSRSVVVLAWLCAPLLVLVSPVRQDGVRYIIPSLLALAMMGAAGLHFALAQLGRRWPGLGGTRALTVAGAVLCGYMAAAAAAVHPYYLDYYGEHVGGPRGVAADKAFEIAWWGEGIEQAVAFVNRNAEEGARVYKACVEPSHLTWLRGDLWKREARDPAKADWIIVYQPSWRGCPVPGDARLVHEVQVRGAPLVRVYRRGTDAKADAKADTKADAPEG